MVAKFGRIFSALPHRAYHELLSINHCVSTQRRNLPRLVNTLQRRAYVSPHFCNLRDQKSSTVFVRMSSDLEVVSTDKAPAAVGPYSQAVKHGDYVFVAGQIALHPTTGKLVGETQLEQVPQAMKNLQAVLEASGSSLSHVTKVTAFLTDISELKLVNEIYGQFFGEGSNGHKPARSAVQVAALPLGAKFEVEAIAVPRLAAGDARTSI